MTTDEKITLITRNLQETLTVDELRSLIDSETPLKHYIGFEISGKLHIGYLFAAMKVKDMQDAGAETTIWLADLHSAINDKLGGDLETIKSVAHGYFTDAFKAIFESIGGNSDKLIFKLCSDTYSQNQNFWLTLLEVGKATSLARTKRSITIMGREGSDDAIETAKLFYPIMQAADIFLLQANIAHAGMDQRKVHVVARDSAMQVKTNPLKNSKGEQIKPIAIHHPILLSLTPPDRSTFKGQEGEDITVDEIAMKTKMSKSKPEGNISIHDSEDEIRRKISKAFAPEGETIDNPILNWIRYLIFYTIESSLTIKRDEKFGGGVTYTSYEELEKDYAEKNLHPMDLKAAVAEWLIVKLEPARRYFEDPKRKAALEEIEALTSKK